jgi:hypothetical protein
MPTNQSTNQLSQPADQYDQEECGAAAAMITLVIFNDDCLNIINH